MPSRRPAKPPRPEPPQLDLFAAPAARAQPSAADLATCSRRPQRPVQKQKPELRRNPPLQDAAPVEVASGKPPAANARPAVGPSPEPATFPERSLLKITVAKAIERYGIGRTTLYALIARGALHAVKVGARTLIDVPGADAFFSSLPPIRPRSSNRASS